MTTNPAKQLSDSHDVSAKVTKLVQTRTKLALDRYNGRVKKAYERTLGAAKANPVFLSATLRRRGAVRRGLRAALDPVLGHAAPARQQLPRARAAGIAAGASLRLRDDHGRTLVEASGQLRAAAHRSAERRDGRPQSPPLRDHRPARRPRSRHRWLQGRFAGRRGAARRPPRVLRRLLPESRAGSNAARRVRRGARVRAPRARVASERRKAGDRRQLSGRLGRDDARRFAIRTTPVRS